MAKKKTKVIIRKIIKRVEVAPKDYEVKKVGEEIKELETSREQAGKGFRGFLRRAAINRRINDKRGYIVAKDRLRSVTQQNQLGRALLEKEKTKIELNNLRKKSQVSFDGLGGDGLFVSKKNIGYDDIFR